MSDPVILTGCAEPIYGVAVTPVDGCPPFFDSQERTASCPSCSTGGPFTSVAGKFTSTLSQADADAQAEAYLATTLATKCIAIQIPVITNDTIMVTNGTPITPYQIVATNNPTSYGIGMFPLPTGLSLDTITGIITGTPSGIVTAQFTGVNATNCAGTGNGLLTFTASMTGSFSVVATTPDYGTDSGPSSFLTFTLDGGSPFLSVPGTTYYYNTSLRVDAALTHTLTLGNSTVQTFQAINSVDLTINTASENGTLSATAGTVGLTILFSDFNTGDLMLIDEIGPSPQSGTQSLGSPVFIAAGDFLQGSFSGTSDASPGSIINLSGTIQFSL